jgi:uncharacterized protein YfaS (alpha-2-macroglobulin family)
MKLGGEKVKEEFGQVVLELTFTPRLPIDYSLAGKPLTEEERPFKASWSGLTFIWRDNGSTLRIRTGLSREEFFRRLLQEPLAFDWGGKRGPNITPDRASGGGRVLIVKRRADGASLISLPEPRVMALASLQNETLSSSGINLILIFNYPMVGPEEVKRGIITLAETPVTLEPDPGWEASWIGSSELVLRLKGLSPNDYADKIVDQKFQLAFRESFVSVLDLKASVFQGHLVGLISKEKTLFGAEDWEKLSENDIYFDRFKVLSFKSAGFTPKGRAIFELVLNKPVNEQELRRALKLGLFQDSGSLTTALDPQLELDSSGLVARLIFNSPNGAHLRLLIKNLASRDKKGNLSRVEFTAQVQNNVTIRDAGLERGEEYPWDSYFDISIRERFPEKDLSGFIRLDPPLPFQMELTNHNSTLRIRAPFTREGVKITLLPGLPSELGVLTEPVEFLAQFTGEPKSRLTFTGRGRYLSPLKPLLVKVAGRETDSIRVQAWRIYENNLPFLLSSAPILDSERKARLGLQMSKNLLDFEVPVGSGDSSFERLLDLGGLFKEPLGAYVLKVTPIVILEGGHRAAINRYDYADDNFNKPYYDYDDFNANPQRYLPVVVTDLGLSARVYPGQIQVWVASLATAKPLAGTQVKFYDQANQVVFEGVSDAKGLVLAKVDEKAVVFVTAQREGDLSYLLFGQGPKSQYEEGYNSYWQEDRHSKWFDSQVGYLEEERGSGDPFLTAGYEGLFLLPRDIWKPGETLRVKALIRDQSQNPPKESFPLLWRVVDPDDRVIDEGRAEVSLAGSLDFVSQIPFSARTGPYQIRLFIPGSSSPLAQGGFKVDDFVPPRLNVKLSVDQAEFWGAEPTINLAASAQYLFGAPGSELPFTLTARAKTGHFAVPEPEEGEAGAPKTGEPSLAAFDFVGPQGNLTKGDILSREGELDESGAWGEAFEPGLELATLPNVVNLTFSLAVEADSGRLEGTTKKVKWYPHQTLVGLKLPDELAVGRPGQVFLAALTAQGQPAPTESLKITLAQVKDRYYSEVRYGRVYRHSVEELTPVLEETVSLAQGQGSLKFQVAEPGLYEISVQVPDEEAVIARRLRVQGLAATRPEESGPADKVTLTLDKAFYFPGDVPRVQIVAPFDGTVWLTLETNRPLWSQTLEVKGGVTEVRIPLPPEVVNNAQLTAALARPVAAGASNFLALGRVSLEMDRSVGRLDLQVETPARLLPKTSVPLKIRLTDSQGRPVAGEATVALVDEGILSLTNYQVPNPLDYFSRSRSLISYFHDLRDLLLPLEEPTSAFLAPGGGERAGLFSPFQRKQELLSIFLATVPIGPDGVGEAVLDLPEYSGQGRLTVVAAQGRRYGLYNQSLRISRPVTVEPALPLALAPGDEFSVNTRVYLDPDSSPAKLDLGLEFSGPLSLVAAPGWREGRLTVALAPGESQVFQLRLKAVGDPGQALVGPAELKIFGSYNDESFVGLATTVVRPPYPRVSRAVSGAMASATETWRPPIEGFLAGTITGSLSLAAGPWVEANRARAYLSQYPYGCLEQTVSRAWLFLAAADLETLSEAEALEAQVGLAAAIKRLATMQTFQGGMAFWPGGLDVYEWGSVYAAHFLTEAKKQRALPAGLLEDTLSYLRNYLAAKYDESEALDYILATKAYALYVLALNGDYQAGWINALRERSAVLPPSALIFLSGAIALKEGHSRPLLELDQKGLDWNLSTLSLSRSSLESRARNEALWLLAWSAVDPLAERTRELAAQVATIGSKGGWTNTQENGLALWALANYMKRSQAGAPYEAKLLVGDLVLGTATHQDMSSWRGAAFDQAIANPANVLTIAITGQGRPWYSGVVAGVPVESPPPVAQGLKLTKTWTLEDGSVLEFGDQPVEIQVPKGQKVKVKIVLETEEESLQNVVIADLLPGGLEIAKTESGSSTRAEIREDRLILIEPYLDQKTSLSYELRAVTEGDFVLPPTAAEGMYQPEKRVIGATGRVKVTARDDG